jgi:signal transduction histidine kinase
MTTATISTDDLERQTLAELRTQARAEQWASWIATAGVIIVSVAADEPRGIAFAAFIGAMAAVRLLTFPALDRSDVVGALAWTSAGTWGVAIGVTAVIPDTLPIMVLNLIGPLVTGALHLDAPRMRRFTIAGGVVAVVLGVLGFRSEGFGIEDAISETFFQAILVTYLVAHVVMMIVSVGTANRIRLDTIRALAASNRALVASETELRSSRRRVISAGDQERVRLERNIHDGAQQRLVALAVQLQLAEQQRSVTADQLGALHAEARAAIDELRELARGIYPPVLAERGLEEALRSVAGRSPHPVEVTYDPAIELERDDAAAVYFVCLEALQNVAKHGEATTSAHVQLSVADGDLVVTVSDDGPGFDPGRVGASRGLLNMADRAGALGGELTVDAVPGGGTRITMVVPQRVAANVDA